VNELAIAMCYASVTPGNASDPVGAAAAVYGGYCTEAALTPDEDAVVALLACCRLVCSVTMGAYSFSKDPTNEYLML
jgi:Ser/Thr protein kinase RdoA (MazF antagonist)